MNRRGFLKAVGTAGILLPAAPVICKSEWLMPVKPRPESMGGFIIPGEFADLIIQYSKNGITDWTTYWQKEARYAKAVITYA